MLLPLTSMPPSPKSSTPPPTPPPPPTPLPEYIAQFIGQQWFEKMLPNATSKIGFLIDRFENGNTCKGHKKYFWRAMPTFDKPRLPRTHLKLSLKGNL